MKTSKKVIDKDAIVYEYFSSGTTLRKLSHKYGIDHRKIHRWVMAYKAEQQEAKPEVNSKKAIDSEFLLRSASPPNRHGFPRRVPGIRHNPSTHVPQVPVVPGSPSPQSLPRTFIPPKRIFTQKFIFVRFRKKPPVFLNQKLAL